MRIRFWGVRGTVPTPGPNTVRYGGNTPCLDILTSNQQIIILDAGTGIRILGEVLKRENPRGIRARILLSHTHWDHIQGLPFFTPLQSRRNRFETIGQKRTNRRLEKILSRQFQEPYLPFAYRSLAAGLDVTEIEDTGAIVIDDQVSVKVASLNHPGGCLGFRVEDGATKLAYCTDTAWDEDNFSESVLLLVKGVDLLIHDSFFADPKEAKAYADWGHSSWLQAAQLAVVAEAKALTLFHYAPGSTDDELEQMRAKARAIFPRTILAREGMTVHLPIGSDMPE